MQPFYSVYGIINTLTYKHWCHPIKAQSVLYILQSKACVHTHDQIQMTIENFCEYHPLHSITPSSAKGHYILITVNMVYVAVNHGFFGVSGS